MIVVNSSCPDRLFRSVMGLGIVRKLCVQTGPVPARSLVAYGAGRTGSGQGVV